ncbi:uncharacterized protein LOC117653655 [Thrips palmi]|uniref:Uncharacterized protein LOC117653655 n=1 Tax=Thrips palmi TaxID=161013 RepID=A0A6P9AIU5_THRPL|nr:uncharacterized protein LOC117653655 [Thrips palmi]
MAGLMPTPASRSNSTNFVDENGYVYSKRAEHGTTRYMYCKTVGCSAHGRDILGVFQLDVPHEPLCRPNPDQLLLNRMREEIRQLARQSGRVEESFRTVERNPEYRTVRHLITLDSFNSSIRRAASLRRPNPVHSVEAFVQALQGNEHYRTNTDGEEFYLRAITVDDRIHVVFGSVATLRALADGRDVELHVDAAVKTVPALFQQLFAVQVVNGDHVFGILYVLMTRRREPDYQAILEYLRDSFPMNVVSVMADFERALRNAVGTVLPQARLNGCWTHYCRRVDKRCLRGSLPAVSATEDGHRLIRMVKALPLLPADLILRGYLEVLLPYSRRVGQNAREARDLRTFMRAYVRGFWLTRVGTDQLSVAGLRRRTNNDSESWNSYLLRVSATTQDNTWNYTETLQNIESRDRNDFARWDNDAVPPRRPRGNAMKERDARIKKALENLVGRDGRNVPTTAQLDTFLRSMAYVTYDIIPMPRGVEDLDDEEGLDVDEPMDDDEDDDDGGDDPPDAQPVDRARPPAEVVVEAGPAPQQGAAAPGRGPAPRPAMELSSKLGLPLNKALQLPAAALLPDQPWKCRIELLPQCTALHLLSGASKVATALRMHNQLTAPDPRPKLSSKLGLPLNKALQLPAAALLPDQPWKCRIELLSHCTVLRLPFHWTR